MEGKTLARIGAIVFVAFALGYRFYSRFLAQRIFALAEDEPVPSRELTREEEPSRAAPAPAFAPSVDPLRAEQRRCQRLGEAAVRDAACLEVWAETRDRFLGRTPSDPVRRDNESQ